MANEETDPERRRAPVLPAGVWPSWGTAQPPPWQHHRRPRSLPQQASLQQAGCGDRAPPAGCWHFLLPLSNTAEQIPRQALWLPGSWYGRPPHTPAGHGDEPTPLSITASSLACPIPLSSSAGILPVPALRCILSHPPSHVPPMSLPFHRLQG